MGQKIFSKFYCLIWLCRYITNLTKFKKNIFDDELKLEKILLAITDFDKDKKKFKLKSDI